MERILAENLLVRREDRGRLCRLIILYIIWESHPSRVSCVGFIESVIVAPTGTETQAIRPHVIANEMIGLILRSTAKASPQSRLVTGPF
jgi:hypothetical protein